jgi:predicted kinase
MKITKISKSEKTMYIMRGISGSGKSTMAKTLVPEGNIFSTDEFFMVNGEYKFNPSKLGIAHKWNFDRVRKAVEDGITPIAVDNTNTQSWEAKNYVDLAKENGYDIQVRESNTPWAKDLEELHKKNTHGVPKEAIKRMLDRFEDEETFKKGIGL